MDRFEQDMSQLLISLYRSIEKLEETMLRVSHNIPLTISEVHMLEAVANAGKDGAASIGDLSEYLDIRPPSVTAAVNKLAGKGYLAKEKCGQDARVVRVSLTREGRRAERAHRYFHRTMVRNVTKDLTDREKVTLLRGVAKLDHYLDINIKKYEAQG